MPHEDDDTSGYLSLEQTWHKRICLKVKENEHVSMGNGSFL
jgi:hypothetical protein